MKLPILFLPLLFISLSAGAQLLNGTIVNERDEPVPYAVIYVKDIAQGASAGENGQFSLKVKAGTYRCSFQSLGHETVEQAVTVPEGGSTNLRVVLTEKPYMLADAVVGTGGKVEDPAYRIMRKAIGMAPYYLNQVSEYKSNVYLKGTLTIKKISGMVKVMAGKEIKQLGLKEGEQYLQESVNEISFRAPNIFKQKVKSVSGTFPQGMGDFYFSQISVNIYDTNGDMFISPLAPNAFSSYRFVYEGCSFEGERLTNKIKVVPKQKSKLLVSGYLYIDEDSWSVKEFDLSGETVGVQYRNRQSFAEVRKGVFLPISYLFDFNVSVMGNAAELNYKSVVKYEDVKVNPNAQKLADAAAKKAATESSQSASAKGSSKKQKIDSRIEQLMAKPNLNTREAMELAKLMGKSAEEAKKNQQAAEGSKKDPLELERTYQLEVDSLAKKRDTLYWTEMRPIPLSNAEVKSYVRKDSLTHSGAFADSTKKNSKTFTIVGLVMGKRYYIGDSSAYISHDGLLALGADGFHPVDGFSYGQEVRFNKRFKDTTTLLVALNGRYAFSREAWMGTLRASYRYWPEKRATVQLRGGVSSTDFNELSGLDFTANMYAALFAHYSYINLYDNRFVELSHTIDIANGFNFGFRATYADRRRLENTTNYSFFFKDREYRSNDPVNPYVLQNPALLNGTRSTVLYAKLSYTPQYYYRMYGRVKRMVRSGYPTFSVAWEKGLPDVFSSSTNYDLGLAAIEQTLDLGLMKSLSYSVSAGKFFNRKQMHFADFQHFNTQEPDLITSTFTEKMMYFPKTYTTSTNEWFVKAGLMYQTPYLLLKYLPFLSNTLWQEGLHFSYLKTPYSNHHIEAGYSITNIGFVAGVGVFVGFDDFEYSNIGFKISVPVFNIFGER